MKPLHLSLALLGALGLAACASDYRSSDSTASGGGYTGPAAVPADYYDMAYDERHRAWWLDNERDQDFDRRVALTQHRAYCDRNASDLSCEGWYHPPLGRTNGDGVAMMDFRWALLAGAITLVIGVQVHAAAQAPAPATKPANGPSERDIEFANDPHLRWWEAYHPGEKYQAATALAAHRLFCQDHKSDSSCAGWDWH